MHFNELNRGELLAMVGGAILALSVFLPWFDLGNSHAMLNQCHGPNTTCTGWNSLGALRYLILLTAIAPTILAYIIVRGHALSWPRGELTALTALMALTFTLFRGIIDKPGTPAGEITVDFGWWIGLA